MTAQKPKTVEVGCAVIIRGEEILIAQRKPGSHLGGYWEFPGGKREADETMEACLVREAGEELGVEICPVKHIRTTVHHYPERMLVLCFYICNFAGGQPKRRDCLDFAWVRPENLHSFLFPPADRDLIRDLIQKKRYYFQRGYCL